MQIEQVILCENGRVAARSRGVVDIEVDELVAWRPMPESFVELRSDAVSIDFFRLASGRYCIAKTTLFPSDGSGRRRLCAQCLLVQPESLFGFGNNPLSLLNAAFAQGQLRVHDSVPDEVEAFRLLARVPAVDHALLLGMLIDPGIAGLGVLVERAVNSEQLALVTNTPPVRLFAALMSSLPIECRHEFSFSTGMCPQPRHFRRVLRFSRERCGELQAALPDDAVVVDLASAERLAGNLRGWSGFVTGAVATGRLAYFGEMIATPRPWLATSDLNALGDELLDDMVDKPVRSATTMVDAVRRADGEHTKFVSQAPPAVVGKPQAGVDLEPAPSAKLADRCPAVLDELELLDDLVFDTIAGKPGAMDELRVAWKQLRPRLEPDVLEDSRSGYVRHALEAWRQCVDGEELRNPKLALAALDVVDLLFND